MSPVAGVSLKPQHYAEALGASAAGLWFEVHPENYMCAGGPRHAWLNAIREQHPLSLHGVGLSLAGVERPDMPHLTALADLDARYEPFVVSEHLAWCRHEGIYFPDLLPFPRTRDALVRISAHVGEAQDALQRRILIENPSLYLPLDGHGYSEVDFLKELVRRSGCGLLVDVNNIFVSAANLGGDPVDYVDAIPGDAVGEIHLAGHRADEADHTLLIDTHGEAVCEDVWALYQRLIARIGARPTLIERDENIPTFSALMRERARADSILQPSTTLPAQEMACG